MSVRTTEDILHELDGGPSKSNTGKTREELGAYAQKDREFHHVVDFHSADDPRHYIPNRFLIRPDGSEDHDSDSEEESDVEADLEEDLEERKEEVDDPAPLSVAASSSGAAPSGTGSARKGRGKRRKPKERKPKGKK